MLCGSCNETLPGESPFSKETLPGDKAFCTKCNNGYHFQCTTLSEVSWRSMGPDRKAAWRCMSCRDAKAQTVEMAGKQSAGEDVSIQRNFRKLNNQLKCSFLMNDNCTKQTKGNAKSKPLNSPKSKLDPLVTWDR